MKRIFAILLAILMIISLAACGESSDKTDSTSTASSTGAKKYATLQDYMDDPVNMKGIDSVKESGQDVLEINIKADGSTMLYEYTYKTTFSADDLPSMKQSIEEAMASNDSTFTTLATNLQSQIDEKVNVRVVYRNGDGEIIFENTYDPTK